MAGFVYFVPGLTGVDAGTLAAGVPAAIREVLRDCALQFHGCSEGPDGGPGQCVGAETRGLGYYPDTQDWQEADGYWIGVPKGRPPGPDDLKRGDLQTGHGVKLADGHEWAVPAAAWLPRRMAYRDGKWVSGAVDASFTPLSDAADRILELYSQVGEGGAVSADDTELISLALAGLGVNYRLGPHEASILGLFDSHNVWRVLEAVIDLPRFVAMQEAEQNPKAEAPDAASSPNTGSGDPGHSENTSPATPT